MIPKSLAMIKMEKNFRAHNDKGYMRMPYQHYDMSFWIYRLEQELQELKHAHDIGDYENMREELGDISNLCDYGFERAWIEEADETRRSEQLREKGLSQLFEHNEQLEKGGE